MSDKGNIMTDLVREEVTLLDGTVEIREYPAPVVIPLVPDEIQMWQARAMLIRMGLISVVNQAVAASGNPEIQNAWEYAPNVVRRSNFVLAMASAIGLSEDQLDTLFIEGAKIK